MREARRLPEHDDAIASLDPATRQTLASLWRDRATTELGAGWGFSLLVVELHALGAERAVLALATQGAADEIRHAELCVKLAERYAGGPMEPAPTEPVVLPSHPGADERLRMQLHAAGLAISETLAAAFLERCLAEAEARDDASPTVLAVLRDHLSDDVAHARVGFAHLASRAVSDEERAGVARFLPRLLHANLRHWRERIVELPVVPAHGYPAHEGLLASVETAAREVLLPGFAHVGITPS